jgi:hypothetical protein
MDTASPITPWGNFYVIVGSAAAALTGLQFVVIALIAQARTRASGHEIAAFGSPTIVHFCSALFIAATLSAPWRSLQGAGLTISACGLAGVVYSIAVARRARRQTGYKPVFEDWLWHIALPLVAYATLLVAGFELARLTTTSLFATAVMTLLLVYIGIHNSWDTVVYITVNFVRRPED